MERFKAFWQGVVLAPIVNLLLKLDPGRSQMRRAAADPRPKASAELGGIRVTGLRGRTASGFTRVGLVAYVFDGRLHLSWQHLASHLRPETVAGWAAEMRRTLERAGTEARGYGLTP